MNILLNYLSLSISLIFSLTLYNLPSTCYLGHSTSSKLGHQTGSQLILGWIMTKLPIFSSTKSKQQSILWKGNFISDARKNTLQKAHSLTPSKTPSNQENSPTCRNASPFFWITLTPHTQCSSKSSQRRPHTPTCVSRAAWEPPQARNSTFLLSGVSIRQGAALSAQGKNSWSDQKEAVSIHTGCLACFLST